MIANEWFVDIFFLKRLPKILHVLLVLETKHDVPAVGIVNLREGVFYFRSVFSQDMGFDFFGHAFHLPSQCVSRRIDVENHPVRIGLANNFAWKTGEHKSHQ